MARTLIAAVLVAVGLALGLAPTTGQRAAGNRTAEQEVRAVERQRAQALLKRDINVLERTMAEDYRFTDPDGRIATKTQELAGFQSGDTRFEAFDTRDVQVRVYGNTAVVTGHASIKGRSHDRDIGGEYRYTRVYVKEGAPWRMVSSHFSRAAAPHRTADEDAEVVTIRPPAAMDTRQGLRQFVGISEATAGTKGISMNLVVVPAGGAAAPHTHSGFESAVYVLKGRVETRYGRGLAKSVINQEGDFVFIPPNVPHQPRNLSATESALAIVARNDPNEQENVVPYDPAAAPRARP
jgi:uncharacterized RmlC-like cupin family protein/ketosteroid isomerase-like protein